MGDEEHRNILQVALETPLVFEGHAPADVRENFVLQNALSTKPASRPVAAHAWLGAPNSIKGPTEAVFRRQSGNHLLVVGQRDESILTMLGLSMISLAAQYPAGTVKFIFLDSSTPGTPDADFLERIFKMIPHGVKIVRSHELGDVMTELDQELKDRTASDSSQAPSVFLFIHGLHKWKKLKSEDDFSFSMGDSDAGANPATVLGNLLTEGSSAGIHVIATTDTFNNVGRFLNRKALTEFEMRVVFQMSANDSASLIDSPKASGLGLHRALLYNEHEGYLETFRPYAAPDTGWFDEAAQKLA